jgi:glycolate oxidase iron-sulfur subunit
VTDQGSPTPEHLLASLKPDLDRCNKCGFCMAGCPTYRVGGQLEWLVTRGRVSLVQDALAGTLPLEEIAIAVDTCLLCNACLDHCPPKVPIDHLMTSTRAAMRRQRPLPWPVRFLLRQVLPRPRLLRLLARAAGLGERLGLRRAAGPLLKRWPALDRASQAGPALPGVTARALLKGLRLRPDGAPRGRIAYFLSCTRQAVYPHAARAAIRVLVAAGYAVTVPDAPCCGLPCHSLGDPEGAARLAAAQQRLFGPLDVEAVVSDDGSCTAHLAQHLPVTDFATFLAERGLPAPLHRIERRVTWHDPCSLKHHLGIWAAPRQLIRSLPGIEYVEATDADVCCGGAGSFMITQPELSDRILDLKHAAFAATGAAQVITSSPSCLMQLGRSLPVSSLAELLEEACCPREATR